MVQAVILNNFKDWPSAAITVEFWMWSVDRCRRGVPVSYATGGYEKADNSFLILNYNDWWACIFQSSAAPPSQSLPSVIFTGSVWAAQDLKTIVR